MQKIIAFAIVIAVAADAQKIETEKPGRHRVMRVETAPNHLSVIELADPVTEVAAGSSSFKIEWRGNKVFVEPLDSDATTNLFIWTATERLTYELVPAPSVEEMHFAIDQGPSQKETKAAISEKTIEEPPAAQEAKFAAQMLFGSTPVRVTGYAKNRNRVQVLLKDIFRENDRVYVRYAIQNNGHATYASATPGVFALRSPRSSSSLYALSKTQVVGDGIRITSRGESPIKVLSAEMRVGSIPPGASAWGVVTFELPSPSNVPAIVKFAFPADDAGEVTALLVL
jgi:hypothetical protein